MPVPVIGSPPSTNPPRTSPAPSPYIAASPNPAPPSSRVSPAYHEAPHPNDEPQAFVEQEQQSDHFMASESPDRSHLRKDSHLGSQGTQNSPHMEKLPPISSFQMPSSLAQIPTTTGYGPILPRPSQMKHSPPMNCASSPQSPYHSGAINGNDRQTVMMSPNTMLRPLQPPFSITTVPTMLTSIFNDHRPQSRPNGSPPEH